MKNNDSLFSKIIVLIILALLCVVITLTASLLIGSVDRNIFDFSNINWYNAVPVLIVGGILSCFVIGIGILFLSRNVFNKVKKYIFEDEKNGGDKK